MEPRESRFTARLDANGPKIQWFDDCRTPMNRRNLRALATKVLARLVSGAGDAQLERRFGSLAAQRALFTAMAWAADPEAAEGFEGAVVYELATAEATAVWTVEIAGGRARIRRGVAVAPMVTLRLRLADFVRVIAGTIDPVQPLLEGRADIEGDLAVAARLPEIFGV
jgi:putative sterol carrier protein